jgi:beta-glucosidase
MKGEPLFTRTDDMIDFYWDNDSPHSLMPVNDFGIHWVADLVPPVSRNVLSWHMGFIRL